MSELKPGWAEAFGKAQAGDSEAESRMRRKGRKGGKPFTEHARAVFREKCSRAVVKAHRTQRLERVLGPITED